MLILIRGAGDIASGIALRLHRCGFSIVMTDLPKPTAIRRTVAFSEAIRKGVCQVEEVRAAFANNVEEAKRINARGEIAVLADPEARCRAALEPEVLVDAILAKKNLGTRRTDAPLVIGVGPGFTALEDCDAVVETMRGHDLGRVFWKGTALKNTGVPAPISGVAEKRLLRAPADGVFHQILKIGTVVKAGDVAGRVDRTDMLCRCDGVLRGILPDGTPACRGMKAGDVDPRCEVSHCTRVSDKAMAIAGGVLEAILSYTAREVRGTPE